MSGDGSKVIVGAPGDDTEGENVGAAYIFNAAILERTIYNPSPDENDKFGKSVAMSGDGSKVVDSTGAFNAGAAFFTILLTMLSGISFENFITAIANAFVLIPKLFANSLLSIFKSLLILTLLILDTPST